MLLHSDRARIPESASDSREKEQGEVRARLQGGGHPSPRVQVLLRSGRRFYRNKFALSFGLKKGFIFHFDSETCLKRNFFGHFLSAGNIKPNLK